MDHNVIARRGFLFSPMALAMHAAERKPNLLLLIAKVWRAQATPWAGDLDLAAPNLEKFGRQSMVFPRAYSCYPRSPPALAALLTGRFPHTTGVIKDGAPLPAGEVTLEAVLKSAGYKTASLPSDAAIEFLEKNPAGPFFLNVSLETGSFVLSGHPDRLHLRENVPSDAETNARMALSGLYARCSILDSVIGKLAEAVDNNTIVVFTSDHGEQRGSQGLEDDDVAFEESVRIPLAIRYPGALPAGSSSDVLVSQVDLMPTLLALCGESAPEGVQGHDLSAVLRGQKGERPESVYAEGKIGQKDEWRMLVRGFDKIVVNSQTEVTHLYNLAEDPYELTNLAHEPGEKLKRDSLLAVLRVTAHGLGDFKKRP